MVSLVDLHDLLEADWEAQGMSNVATQGGQATPTAKQQAVIVLRKTKEEECMYVC